MNSSHWQFSLKRLFLATFWIGVCAACVLTNRRLVEFDMPSLLRRSLSLATFWFGITAFCIAIGTLLGSAKTGAIVGLLATSAILLVASVQGLLEIGLNSIDSDELLVQAALSPLGLGAALWLYFRRSR